MYITVLPIYIYIYIYIWWNVLVTLNIDGNAPVLRGIVKVNSSLLRPSCLGGIARTNGNWCCLDTNDNFNETFATSPCPLRCITCLFFIKVRVMTHRRTIDRFPRFTKVVNLRWKVNINGLLALLRYWVGFRGRIVTRIHYADINTSIGKIRDCVYGIWYTALSV